VITAFSADLALRTRFVVWPSSCSRCSPCFSAFPGCASLNTRGSRAPSDGFWPVLAVFFRRHRLLAGVSMSGGPQEPEPLAAHGTIFAV
jgi:hypothetical protein